MKIMTTSENVRAAIRRWQETHEKGLPKKLDESNFERAFVAIYAFRNIILLIDMEMEDEKLETDWKPLKIETSNGEMEIKVETKVKLHRLIEKWDKLGEVGMSSSAIKDLGIHFFDVIRLRYANYLGFIHSITDFDYVIYENN